MIAPYASPTLRDQFLSALDANDRALLAQLAVGLTGCMNALPGMTCDQLGLPIGSTYGSAARRLLLLDAARRRVTGDSNEVHVACHQSKPEHEAACNKQSELVPAMVEVLECLKKYGQRLDLEIARELKMPLATVRERIAGLAATGAVITCRLTRFEGGKRIDAWQCRVSGYAPPPAPGRKAKPAA